jgi:hypothetical protein
MFNKLLLGEKIDNNYIVLEKGSVTSQKPLADSCIKTPCSAGETATANKVKRVFKGSN